MGCGLLADKTKLQERLLYAFTLTQGWVSPDGKRGHLQGHREVLRIRECGCRQKPDIKLCEHGATSASTPEEDPQLSEILKARPHCLRWFPTPSSLWASLQSHSLSSASQLLGSQSSAPLPWSCLTALLAGAGSATPPRHSTPPYPAVW